MESLQIQVIELQRGLRKCQQQSQRIHTNARLQIATITASLIQQYMDVKHSTNALNLNDLAFKNATKHFTHILKKMEKLGYDTNLIMYLLDANSTVVSFRQKNYTAWIERKQQNRIKELEQDLRMLQYKCDKLTYFLRTGISKPVLTENEEFFLSLSAAHIPMPFTRTTSVSVGKLIKIYKQIIVFHKIVYYKSIIVIRITYLFALIFQNKACFNSYTFTFKVFFFFFVL